MPMRLTLGIGKYRHSFGWHGAQLEYGLVLDRPVVSRSEIPTELPPAVAYDPERFHLAVRAHSLTAVVDHWGQVLLFRHDAFVAAILVRRGAAAVWLPDGTAWGSAKLLGRPATPNAAVAVARALRGDGR